MANIETWDTTAGNNTSSPPDGAPEGWSSASVNDTIREQMAALARAYKGTGLYTAAANLQASLEWLDLSYGKTIQRDSNTQVKVLNADVRTYFTAHRRVRIISAAASADGYVAADATLSGSDTVVTVTMDAATVPASPTKLLAFVGHPVRSAAFYRIGAGNGLDADKVDGLDASQLGAQRNVLINGRFDLWQRGTTIPVSASSAYSADRWRISSGGGGGAVTVTRRAFTVGQTDVPTEPRYYFEAAQTGGASTIPILEQRIESVRTLAGQQVTVSFYAKAAAGLNVVGVLKQNFGTGGSPSADVDHSLGTFAVTTSWVRYTATVTLGSISGKTLGTGENDYLALRFEFPTGTTYTFHIAGVQVERGGSASELAWSSVQAELAAAARYFWKTYDVETAPGTGTKWAGCRQLESVNASWIATVPFGATMRAAPTVTFYAPGSGTEGKGTSVSNSSEYDLVSTILVAGGFAGTHSGVGNSSTAVRYALGVLSDVLLFHLTADAEL